MADRKCFILCYFFVILLQLTCCEKVPETEEGLTNIEDAIDVGKEEYQAAFSAGTLVPEAEEDRPPDNSKGNPQIRSGSTDDPPQGTSEEANEFPRGTPDRGDDVPEEAQSVNSNELPEDSQVEERDSDDEATDSSDSGQGYFSQVLSNLAAPLFEEEDFLSEENDGPDVTDSEDQTTNTIPIKESERTKDLTEVDEADNNDHPQSQDVEEQQPAVAETIMDDHLEETAGMSSGEESDVGSTSVKERKLSDEEVEHLRVRKPTDSRVQKKEEEEQKHAPVERKQDTDEQSTEETMQEGYNVIIHEEKEEKQDEEGRGMEKVPQGTAETFKKEEREPVKQERSEMERETPDEKKEWQSKTTKPEMDNIRAEVRTDREQEKKRNREQKDQQTEPKILKEERTVTQEEVPKEVVVTRNEDIQNERTKVNEQQRSDSRNELNTNGQQETQEETTEEEFRQKKFMQEKERAREMEEQRRRVELLKEQKRKILEQERLKKEGELRKLKELEKAEEQAKAYQEEREKQRKIVEEKRKRRAKEAKVEKGSTLATQEKLEQEEEVGQRRAELKESAKRKGRTTSGKEDLQAKNEEHQRAEDLRKQRTAGQEKTMKDAERQKNEELRTRRFEVNQQESEKDPGLEIGTEQLKSDGREQGVEEGKNDINKDVKHLNLEGKSNLHTMEKVAGHLDLGNGRTLEVKEDELEDKELKMKGEVDKRLAEEEELKRKLDILHQERRKFEEMAEQYRRGKKGSREQKNGRRKNDKVQMPEERKETKKLNDTTNARMSHESKDAQLLNDGKEAQLLMENNDAQLPNDSKAQNGVEIPREKEDKLNMQKFDQEREPKQKITTEPLTAVPKKDSSKFVDPVRAWTVHRTYHDARTSSSVDVLPPSEATGLGEEDVKVIELSIAGQNASNVNKTVSGYAAFMKSFREFHNNSARALLSCWPTVRNITSDLLGYIGLDTMFDQLCHDLADVHPAVLFSTFFFGTIGIFYFLWSFTIGRLKNVARGPNPHDILKSYEARARILEEEVHTLEMDKLRLQAERNDVVNEKMIIEGELGSNKEKIEKTINKIKKLDSEKQRLIVAVEELRVSIQEKTQESKEKEEEIKRFEDMVSELEKKAEVKDEEIRELNEDLQEKIEEKEAAARLVDDLNEKIKQLGNEKNRVEDLMKEDKEKYDTLQGEFDDQLLRFNELQQQYEFKCNEVEVLKDCLKQIKRTNTDDGEETEISAEEMQKRLQDLMDVAKAKEDLQKVEASHQKMSEELQSHLKELRDLKENFEMMKEELQMANSKAQEAALLQREKEIELEALQRYFKATEVDLHKKLSAEEAARISSETKLQSELAKSEDAENYRKLYLELKKETETIHEKRKLQLLEADQRAHENFLSYRKTLRELDALKLDYDLLSKRCYELELKSELINTAKRSFMNPDWRRESPNRASPSSGAMSQGSPVPFGGPQMPPVMPANPPPPPPPAVFNKPMPHPAQVLGMNPHVHPATRGFTTPPPTTGPPLPPQPPHDGRPPMQDMRDRTPPPGPPGRMYANSPPPQGLPPPPPPPNMQYSPAPMFAARPMRPTPPPPPFSSGTRPKPSSQLANLS